MLVSISRIGLGHEKESSIVITGNAVFFQWDYSEKPLSK